MPKGKYSYNVHGLSGGGAGTPAVPFRKGNQHGKKGKNKSHPMAGRKPLSAKRLLNEYFEMPVEMDAERRSCLDIAFDTFIQAMMDRDTDGCVTSAGVNAGKFLWMMAFGRPTEKKEVKNDHLHMLTEVQNMAALIKASKRIPVENTDAANGKNGTHHG